MRVTDITPQERNPQIYNIFLDGKFAFGLSDTEARNHNVHIGIELSKAQVEKLRTASSISKAYNRSLHYISIRPRSVGEVQLYLNRKGYDVAITSKVIKKLEDANLLNDKEFARIWVENRLLLKPSSRRRLEQELLQKKISKDEIKNTLTTYHQAEELDQAQKLVIKKIKNPSYADKQKLLQYIIRQGFSYAIAKKALELATSED